VTEFLTRPLRLVAFLTWFAGQIALSARDVLADVLTPGSSATPRLVHLQLVDGTGASAAALGALITMTPGTLTLGVVDGQDALLVHSMYHPDDAAALDDLHDLQGRLLGALGRKRVTA
jgi:multicomponent Na+:H+ antiporter subunit E